MVVTEIVLLHIVCRVPVGDFVLSGPVPLGSAGLEVLVVILSTVFPRGT